MAKVVKVVEGKIIAKVLVTGKDEKAPLTEKQAKQVLAAEVYLNHDVAQLIYRNFGISIRVHLSGEVK